MTTWATPTAAAASSSDRVAARSDDADAAGRQAVGAVALTRPQVHEHVGLGQEALHLGVVEGDGTGVDRRGHLRGQHAGTHREHPGHGVVGGGQGGHPSPQRARGAGDHDGLAHGAMMPGSVRSRTIRTGCRSVPTAGGNPADPRADRERQPPTMLAMSNFGLPGGPGDDPFGDDNPFKGMPIFGDLAKLFQQQGPVNWDAARQLALSIATGDTTTSEPNVDPLERIKIEQLARVADLQVANATGLSTIDHRAGRHHRTGHPHPVGPAGARGLPAAVREAGRLAAPGRSGASPTRRPSAADPMAWMAPLMQMIGPTMLGMTAGSMVGHLAQRSFGQYDLPIPRPPSDELTIITPNLDQFGEEWSLPGDDLRLWVCLHEIATHAVLGVPHVRAALEGMLASYLDGFEADPGSLERQLGEVDMSNPGDMSGSSRCSAIPRPCSAPSSPPPSESCSPGSRPWSR